MQQETKYPWHKAPVFATCATTNADGSRYWHEVAPVIDGDDWWSSGAVVVSSMAARQPDINWRDSLEMRPKAPGIGVTVPMETAEFIFGFVCGLAENRQCYFLTADHLKVLRDAIQDAKRLIHDGRNASPICVGGPWDREPLRRKGDEIVVPVIGVNKSEQIGVYRLGTIYGLGSEHLRWLWEARP